MGLPASVGAWRRPRCPSSALWLPEVTDAAFCHSFTVWMRCFLTVELVVPMNLLGCTHPRMSSLPGVTSRRLL